MTEVSTIWQRHPALFALGLSALTVAGLAVMLSDAALWKGVGFALVAIPPLIVAFGYLKHRQLSRIS